MADKLLICKHNDGLGHCDVFGGEYCVESPCQHEELVEYVPVVHGRWMRRVFGYDCSECGAIGYPNWKRCPLCEAKMDGERKGDDAD